MIENEEASNEETLLESQEPSKEAEEEFHPFDEVSEEFHGSSIFHVTAEDGLPTQHFEQEGDHLPALSCETLACMENRSAFVIRGEHGKIDKSFPPEYVFRRPDGTWEVRDGFEMAGSDVEPLRPACKHYVRQVTSFENRSDKRLHLRLCAARRTTEGTFMTVRDSAIYACSMREPRDIETEQKAIEAFDDDKVAQGKDRSFHSMFKQEK